MSIQHTTGRPRPTSPHFPDSDFADEPVFAEWDPGVDETLSESDPNSGIDCESAIETQSCETTTSDQTAPSMPAPRNDPVPAEAPAWLTRRRALAAAEASTSAPPSQPAPPPLPKAKARIRITPLPEEELSWREKIKRWLNGFDAIGYAGSLVLHAMLLLCLALWYVSVDEGDSGLSFLASLGEDAQELTDFSVPVDAKLDALASPGGDPPQFQVIPLAEHAMAAPTSPLDMMASSGDSDGVGDSNEDGEGAGPKVLASLGKNAVRKGSFTAWTVPEDPRPGEMYLIMIQVELPRDLKRLNKADLSGIVIGTDGYRQVIPGSRGYLPVVDRRAQLVIQVPGAASLVRDTIEVRSKMLGEEQVLQITF